MDADSVAATETEAAGNLVRQKWLDHRSNVLERWGNCAMRLIPLVRDSSLVAVAWLRCAERPISRLELRVIVEIPRPMRLWMISRHCHARVPRSPRAGNCNSLVTCRRRENRLFTSSLN